MVFPEESLITIELPAEMDTADEDAGIPPITPIPDEPNAT